MKKITLVVIALITHSETIACKCSPGRGMDYFLNSDFVATAVIAEGFEDTLGDLNYNIPEYWIKINPVEVFKGKLPDSLKVTGGGMCVLTMAKASTWIIYARKSQNGEYHISYCSGSEQVDKYENYSELSSEKNGEERKASIRKKIRQLEILRENNIDYTYSQLDINAESLDHQLAAFKDISLNDDFAIFEVELSEDMKVQQVKVIDGFDAKVDKALKKLLSESDYTNHGKSDIQKSGIK